MFVIVVLFMLVDPFAVSLPFFFVECGCPPPVLSRIQVGWPGIGAPGPDTDGGPVLSWAMRRGDIEERCARSSPPFRLASFPLLPEAH